MKSILVLVLFFTMINHQAFSQVGISADGSQPDASAIFDVKSTSKGILFPRMTVNQRNAIVNPAEGLVVFCSNCGTNNAGALCIYTNSDWYTFNFCKTSKPTPGINLTPPSEIIWEWHPSPGAVGYKWGTSNNFDLALDLGTDTSKAEMGITCNVPYTRYVWAYNDCGHSVPLTLTQSSTNCFTCGNSITINHIADSVAPVNKTVTYATVSNIPGESSKCWITSNLGADHQATAKDDATEASAGWYWQFDKKRGFKHDGTTRTPNTSWITDISENCDWIAANDPCHLELDNNWRIPTKTEWTNVRASGNWVNWNGPWDSALKIHAAGRLYNADGTLGFRGSQGWYWGSTRGILDAWAFYIFITSSAVSISTNYKAFATPIRCIRD